MKLPTIKYVCGRKKNTTASATYPIELCISYQSKQKYIATGIRIKLNQWKNNQIVGSLNSIELNKSLDILKNKAWAIVNKLYEEDKEFSINMVADLLRRDNKKTNITFIEYVYKRIKERQVGTGTKKHYMSFVKFLEEWGQIVFFEDLTEVKVRQMDEYLKGIGLKETTIYANYHKHLKMFANDAYIERLIERNPYEAIHITRGQSTQERFLTLEELHKVEDTKLTNVPLQRVRDLFLLQSYTGMAYADIMAFNKDNIVKSGKVTLYKSRRIKTNVGFTTILLDEALQILDKYNYQIPQISNRLYNAELKMLMAACGIDKPVSSHWARITCGYILLNKGVSIEIIAKILGHTNTQVTQKVYAKILDTTIAKTFENW